MRCMEACQGLKEISKSSLGKKCGDLVKTSVAFYQLFLQMTEILFTLTALSQTLTVLTGRPHPPCWGQRFLSSCGCGRIQFLEVTALTKAPGSLLTISHRLLRAPRGHP